MVTVIRKIIRAPTTGTITTITKITITIITIATKIYNNTHTYIHTYIDAEKKYKRKSE